MLALLTTLCLPAQKKEIAEAKTYLKKNQNLDKAEALLRKVVSMPEQDTKLDNYILLADIVRKQYENDNEKLYLKKLSDTASIFPVLRRMFYAFEKLDSVEAIPDKKGVVRFRLRQKNAEYLNAYRPNLFNGGVFSMNKKKFQEAYDCMDAYVDCINQPLFSALNYAENDSRASQAAYWALMAARQLKFSEGVKKHQNLALEYKELAHRTIATLYDEYLEQGDTVTAVEFLRKGFSEHSDSRFFFPRLVDYYSSRNEMDTVRNIVDRALSIEPGNMFYRLAMNTYQLTVGQYDECIALGDSLIHNNDKLAEAYLNVGSSYFNKALQREKKGRENRQKRSEVNKLYELALPYLEKYRSLRSRAQHKWAPMLYSVYLNLNKGEEFEEIERLMQSDNYNKVSKKQ